MQCFRRDGRAVTLAAIEARPLVTAPAGRDQPPGASYAIGRALERAEESRSCRQ
jgi:hypothetical protein